MMSEGSIQVFQQHIHAIVTRAVALNDQGCPIDVQGMLRELRNSLEQKDMVRAKSRLGQFETTVAIWEARWPIVGGTVRRLRDLAVPEGSNTISGGRLSAEVQETQSHLLDPNATSEGVKETLIKAQGLISQHSGSNVDRNVNLAQPQVTPPTPRSGRDASDETTMLASPESAERASTGAPVYSPRRKFKLVDLARRVRKSAEKQVHDRLLLVTIALAAATTVLFSWVQVERYQAFRFDNGDLGNYNQAFYTTAKLGKLLYYTTNIPSGTSGSVFAVHFAPFLLLVVPIYALWAAPTMLLIIKQAALALGAVPLYKLAQLRLRSSTWAGLIAVIYLFSPLTILSAFSTGFDPEVFIPVLLLSAFYFASRGRPVLFLAFWILTLSTIETEGPMLALFGTAWILGTVRFSDIKKRKLAALLCLPVVATAIAVGWTVLSFYALHYLGPRGGSFGVAYGNRFTVLGATTIGDIPLQVLTHPLNAGAALAYDYQAKLLYILLLLGAVAFIALVGQKRYLVPIFAWIVFISLASQPPGSGMYYFGNQYQCYVTPFVFAGLVSGLVWLGIPRSNALLASDGDKGGKDSLPYGIRSWRQHFGKADKLYAVVAAVLVVGLIATSLGPGEVASFPSKPAYEVGYEPLEPTPHDEALQSVINLIPPSASAFVTPHVFTQVSDRADAYTINFGMLFSPPWTYQSTLDHYVNSSDFVLLDNQVDLLPSLVFGQTANLSQFGLMAAVNGSYLYERGWTGSPAFWAPVSQAFGADELNPKNSTEVSNVTNTFGSSLYHAAGGITGEQIWGGPNVPTLPAGRYAATVWMAVRAPNLGSQVTLKVFDHPMVVSVVPNPRTSIGGLRYNVGYSERLNAALTLATMAVTRFPGEPSIIGGNFTLDFNWSGYGYLNVAGFSESTSMSLFVYAITIQQLSA